MSQAPPPLEQDREVIEWMIFHLDKSESDEFFNGLQEFRQRTEHENGEMLAEFREWWTSWMVSLRLHVDSDYQRQVKESLARHRKGDFGEPTGVEELRGRFPA